MVHGTSSTFVFAQVNVFAKAKGTGKSAEKDSHSGGKWSLWVFFLLPFFLKKKVTRFLKMQICSK